MNSRKQLISIEIEPYKHTEIILTNFIKMITNRGLLKKENIDSNIKKVLKSENNNDQFKIKILDPPDTYFQIMIIKKKITTINKTSDIMDFLVGDENNLKIISVDIINKNARNMVIKKFSNTEVFLNSDLMHNLIENILVPEHILLDDNEKKDFIKIYSREKDMPRIKVSDPVARYYNMKIGDICKIIRPSKTAGKVNYYRVVVPGFMK